MDEKIIIKNLEGFFAKAPHLSNKWRDVIVKVVPWLALAFGIFTVLAGISTPDFSTAEAIGGGNNSIVLLLVGIARVLSGVLSLMAFSHLHAQMYKGWRLSVFALSVNIMVNLLSLNLISAVLIFLIGFYFLFEIKSYYK